MTDPNDMDDMKISFKVEITGCRAGETFCPYLRSHFKAGTCVKDTAKRYKTVIENMRKLTKTCPMVRAQFEALE